MGKNRLLYPVEDENHLRDNTKFEDKEVVRRILTFKYLNSKGQV